MEVDPGRRSWNDVDKKLVYFKCLIDRHRPTWTPVELDPADSLSAGESPSRRTGNLRAVQLLLGNALLLPEHLAAP